MDSADVLGGRYRLTERLGEGGMSVVWGAHDEVLGRPVAIKLLSSRFMADWASRELIRAEAQAVARLSHPHVAGVYDYGESRRDDGEQVPYVVMELLRGPSLSEMLSDGPLRPRTALRICAQIAAALSAAHAVGIVHRDVKPANVMLTDTGAKVVDFGVAAVIGDLSEQPDAMMFGTPAYLAPERIEGGPVVPGTDVYALGLLLYRALTGELPWSADTTTQMLYAHMYVEPRPLPPIQGVPSRVNEICQRCLHKDPDRRPTAADAAHWLAQAAGVSVPIVSARRHDAVSPVPTAAATAAAAMDGALAEAALAPEGGKLNGHARAAGPFDAGVLNNGAAPRSAAPSPAGSGPKAGAGPHGGAGLKAAAWPHVAAESHADAGLNAPAPGADLANAATSPHDRGGRAWIGGGRVGARARHIALAGAAAAIITAAVFIMSGGWTAGRPGHPSAQKNAPSGAPGVAREAGTSGTGSRSSHDRDAVAADNELARAAALGDPVSGAPAAPGVAESSAPPTTTGPGIEQLPTPTTAPTPKTIDSPGGSIVVQCVNNLATLLEAKPAEGYITKATRMGPANVVGARFWQSDTQRVVVAAKCKNSEVVGGFRVNPGGGNGNQDGLSA